MLCGSAVVFNDEIHILGTSYSDKQRNHYKWNGTSWTSVSTLPYNFYTGCAVVFNNEIHILGGSTDYLTKHYKWDGTKWVAVSALPYDFTYGCAVVRDNKIHIYGSTANSSVSNYIAHWEWNGTYWNKLSDLPYRFYQGASALLNNEIHIVGGSASNNYHWVLTDYPILKGYAKTNSKIYCPVESESLTNNLTPIEDGYKVTEDGLVEILLKE
jgi:N-acetylneuraminic acid mutarotase